MMEHCSTCDLIRRVSQGEEGLDIIEGVIKTYFEEGGEHIQINVVDDKTLRAAQQTPEKYKGLMWCG